MKRFIGLGMLVAALAAPAAACDVVVGTSAVGLFAAPATAAVVVPAPMATYAVAAPAFALAVPQAVFAQVTATPVVVQQACARPVVRLFGARRLGRTVVRQRVVVR